MAQKILKESKVKKQTILVINPKGGSGKTTIATNLASYYAFWDYPVALADYDPQQSSSFWLNTRPSTLKPIFPIRNIEKLKGDRHYKRIIVDAPARNTENQIEKLIAAADKIIIPVMPSPIDMHAVNRFLESAVFTLSPAKKKQVALVANRYRTNTIAFDTLYHYLDDKSLPFVATLRESQNYIKAFEYGMGIFEFSPYYAEADTNQWLPLIEWIES